MGDVVDLKQQRLLKQMQDIVQKMYEFYGSVDGSFRPYALVNRKIGELFVVTRNRAYFDSPVFEDKNLTLLIDAAPEPEESPYVGFVYNFNPSGINWKSITTVHKLLNTLRATKQINLTTYGLTKTICLHNHKLFFDPLGDEDDNKESMASDKKETKNT